MCALLDLDCDANMAFTLIMVTSCLTCVCHRYACTAGQVRSPDKERQEHPDYIKKYWAGKDCGDKSLTVVQNNSIDEEKKSMPISKDEGMRSPWHTLLRKQCANGEGWRLSDDCEWRLENTGADQHCKYPYWSEQIIRIKRCFPVTLHNNHYYRVLPHRWPMAGGLQRASIATFAGITGYMAIPDTQEEEKAIQELVELSASPLKFRGGMFPVGDMIGEDKDTPALDEAYFQDGSSHDVKDRWIPINARGRLGNKIRLGRISRIRGEDTMAWFWSSGRITGLKSWIGASANCSARCTNFNTTRIKGACCDDECWDLLTGNNGSAATDPPWFDGPETDLMKRIQFDYKGLASAENLSDLEYQYGFYLSKLCAQCQRNDVVGTFGTLNPTGRPMCSYETQCGRDCGFIVSGEPAGPLQSTPRSSTHRTDTHDVEDYYRPWRKYDHLGLEPEAKDSRKYCTMLSYRDVNPDVNKDQMGSWTTTACTDAGVAQRQYETPLTVVEFDPFVSPPDHARALSLPDLDKNDLVGGGDNPKVPWTTLIEPSLCLVCECGNVKPMPLIDSYLVDRVGSNTFKVNVDSNFTTEQKSRPDFNMIDCGGLKLVRAPPIVEADLPVIDVTNGKLPTFLNLEYNSLTTFDATFLSHPSLKHLAILRLNNNMLTEVPVNLRHDLLQSLDLSFNKIQHITSDEKVFGRRMPRLTYLNLASNAVGSLRMPEAAYRVPQGIQSTALSSRLNDADALGTCLNQAGTLNRLKWNASAPVSTVNECLLFGGAERNANLHIDIAFNPIVSVSPFVVDSISLQRKFETEYEIGNGNEKLPGYDANSSYTKCNWNRLHKRMLCTCSTDLDAILETDEFGRALQGVRGPTGAASGCLPIEAVCCADKFKRDQASNVLDSSTVLTCEILRTLRCILCLMWSPVLLYFLIFFSASFFSLIL